MKLKPYLLGATLVSQAGISPITHAENSRLARRLPPIEVHAPQTDLDVDSIVDGINETGVSGFSQRGIDPSATTIEIRLVDADTFTYDVEVSASAGEATAQRRERCGGCGAVEIVALSAKMLDQLAADLAQQLPADEPIQPPQTQPPTRPAPASATTEPPTARPAANRRKVGALGYAGIGVLAAGTAATVTGGVLLGIGEIRDESRPLEIADLVVPGGVTLGVGAAAMITGAVLLALDIKKRRKTVAVAPAWTGSLVGLRTSWRF